MSPCERDVSLDLHVRSSIPHAQLFLTKCLQFDVCISGFLSQHVVQLKPNATGHHKRARKVEIDAWRSIRILVEQFYAIHEKNWEEWEENWKSGKKMGRMGRNCEFHSFESNNEYKIESHLWTNTMNFKLMNFSNKNNVTSG